MQSTALGVYLCTESLHDREISGRVPSLRSLFCFCISCTVYLNEYVSSCKSKTKTVGLAVHVRLGSPSGLDKSPAHHRANIQRCTRIYPHIHT